MKKAPLLLMIGCLCSFGYAGQAQEKATEAQSSTLDLSVGSPADTEYINTRYEKETVIVKGLVTSVTNQNIKNVTRPVIKTDTGVSLALFNPPYTNRIRRSGIGKTMRLKGRISKANTSFNDMKGFWIEDIVDMK